MIYVYPKLPARYTGPFFRVAGNGLANCLFIYARAISLAHKLNAPIITPTWFNLSIGPYIRRQSDKRHYVGLFKRTGEIKGLKKLLVLLFLKHKTEHDHFESGENLVLVVSGLDGFFTPFISEHILIHEYLLSHISDSVTTQISGISFKDCIAVHVRLGDYTEERRVPLNWYIEKINILHNNNPSSLFLLFSDGSDDELSCLMSIPYVKRAFFGSALADIIAISKCKFLIGSDSTFSAWGAYLGQVPSVFYRLKSSPVLFDRSIESIENK